MKKTILPTTLAAAVLAFGLAACDQQQADSGGDDSAVPLQQGAVPQDPATAGGTSSESQPAAVDSTLPATQPDDTTNPSQPSDTQ